MTNLELSYIIADRYKHNEDQRLDLLAIYNKQRPEPAKPALPKKIDRSISGRNLNRSIDISKTWSTASQMDKGLSPKGLGVVGSAGLVR